MDSNADAVGWSFAVGGYFAKHIELNEGTGDGIEVEPQPINVAYPNAGSTYPFSVNDLRWVAGAHISGSNTLGFIAKPNF